MDTDGRITTALERIGVTDVLAWAALSPSQSMIELNRSLDADATPYELEQFIAAAARQSGRFEYFVRGQLVRLLCEHFPDGYAASSKKQYGVATTNAFWVPLFEPSHQPAAGVVLDRVIGVMRKYRAWVPQNANDPLLLTAFEGHSFEPSQRACRRAEVLK
jgi:hypothetical protein